MPEAQEQGRWPRLPPCLGVDCVQCDGRRPTCSVCEQRATECEYHERKSAQQIAADLRQMNNELSREVSIYRHFVEILRGSSEAEVMQLLSCLKNPGGLQEALRLAEEIHRDNLSISRGSASSDPGARRRDSMTITPSSPSSSGDVDGSEQSDDPRQKAFDVVCQCETVDEETLRHSGNVLRLMYSGKAQIRMR
jgi:hypothetical protein